MLCAISGQVPQEPVVSAKSGHVFEKRLVLQYLEQHEQRCPMTNEPLDAANDLIHIQVQAMPQSVSGDSSSKPTATFTPEAASIPQLLSLFQNEWDAAMLEAFTLRKHLDQTRQELSHALYQYDAACRVIARLNGENAALRAKLSQRGSSQDVPMADANGHEGSAAVGLSAEALASIESKQKALAKQRKEFKKKDGPARAALLASLPSDWHIKSSHSLHESDKPGVTCLAIDSKNPTRLLTGGVDKQAKLFDTSTQQLVTSFQGHTKKLSDVAFHPTADLVITASYDKSVKVWQLDEQDQKTARVVHTLGDRTDAATKVSIHATGEYVVSSSMDGTWALHDVRRGQLLAHAALQDDGSGSDNAALCVQFHPDGGIFGTGSKRNLVQMWDVRSVANVASFDGHQAPVSTLSFSENGYHLVTGAQDGVVQLWDLRKLKSVFHVDMNTVSGPESATRKSGPIHQVCFDPSGSHLAVANSALHILKEAGKSEWKPVRTWEDHKAAVTGVQFAPNSSYLATCSMDRLVKLYGR